MTLYFLAIASGTNRKASYVIYDSAQKYNISPKYLLVKLQKEQSLVTEDSPTQKQLDWAAGFAVCCCGNIQPYRIPDHAEEL